MDDLVKRLQTTLILFKIGTGLMALGSWFQLVDLLGGSLEDAIRIPSVVLLMSFVVYWPFFIRKKLEEKENNGST